MAARESLIKREIDYIEKVCPDLSYELGRIKKLYLRLLLGNLGYSF